jgi:flagellar basal body P-ring protein FlgI
MKRRSRYAVAWIFCAAVMLNAQDMVRQALIRDVSSIEGIRDNAVVGYGVVVG